MTQEEILKLCKYYHGEEECPYADRNSQLWWGGEQLFVESCTRDKDFFDRTKEMYLDALDRAKVTHILADKGVAENRRVLIFFLDLWHGKWFPYDSLDAIFDY